MSESPRVAPDAATLDAPTWARAVDGDRAAVELCLRLDVDGLAARRHRLAASLALTALDLGLDGPALAAWRRRLRQVAAHHMVLADALERAGASLGEAGVRWLPIKGLDLASRVYSRPEERPSSDIDLLISGRDLEPARRALERAGWQSLYSGPYAERYLHEEGYAWQARDPRGGLLEVHYRLWGSVAAEVSDVMFEAAGEDPSLPAGGRRLTLADAYVVAATHLWLDPPPRQLGAFRDLAMIGRAAPDLGEAILVSARRFDLQLPVAAAAAVSAGLWHQTPCRLVGARLAAEMTASEKRWLARQQTLASASHATMTLARHFAGRRTRHGLARVLWRRLWSHPGIVETATDRGLAWPRRRMIYQARSWGLSKPPAVAGGPEIEPADPDTGSEP